MFKNGLNNFLKFQKFFLCKKFNFSFTELEGLTQLDNSEMSAYVKQVFESKVFLDKIQINKSVLNKFCEIIKISEDNYSTEEKIKIFHFLVENRKFSGRLFYHFLERGIPQNIKNPKLVLDMLKNINVGFHNLKHKNLQILDLFTLIQLELSNYLNIDQDLFFGIICQLTEIELQSLNNREIIFQSQITKFYDSVCEHLIRNNEKLEIYHLKKLLDSFEKVYYCNTNFNKMILNKLENTSDRLLKENLTIFFPLISNQSIFSNQILIDRIVNLYTNNLNNLFVKEKIVAALRIFVLLHSVFDRNDMFILVNNLISKLDKLGINLLHISLKINLLHCFIYMNSLKESAELKNLIELLQDKEVLSYINSTIITLFHRDVLFYLCDLGISYKVEDFSDSILKDIVIFKDNRKICIEVNGINHYYRDGETNRFWDKFKIKCLKNYGWEVYEVNYKDWVKITKEKRKEYLKGLINF